MEDVLSLTKEENPRSKSWRVQVPARLKEVMADPAMYPYGWKHRPFHAGHRRQEAAAQGTPATGAEEANTAPAHP